MNQPKLLEMQAEAKRQLKKAWQATARAESEEEIKILKELILQLKTSISALEAALTNAQKENLKLPIENQELKEKLAECANENKSLREQLATLQERFDEINIVIEFLINNQDEIEFIISMRELARGTANVSIQLNDEEKLHFFPSGEVALNDADDVTMDDIILVEGAETLPFTPGTLEIAVRLLRSDSDFTVKVKIEN